MKTFKGMALVGSVVLLALAAQGSAAGPATVTNTYTVGVLTVPGVNTGLVLKKGRGVTVTATGTVCYWPGPPSVLCVGPDGEDPSLNTSTGGFVLPGAPGIGLIARVGTGPWVHVGSGPTTLSGRGVLVFAVNDNWFPDNTGSFEVELTVSGACWPGHGHGDVNHVHCGPPGQGTECYPGNGRSAKHEHCGPPGGSAGSPGPASSPASGSSGEHGNSGGNGNSGEHGNSGENGNSGGNGNSGEHGNTSNAGGSGNGEAKGRP